MFKQFVFYCVLITTVATLFAATAGAADFQGTLYFTRFSGGNNVVSETFDYNDVTQTLSLGPQNTLVTVNGADGIMFAPNGNLLVTSNSVNSVYRIDASTGTVLQTVSTGTSLPDYHMALDPSGTQFYSSNSYNQSTGPLGTFTINPNGSINNATLTTITGGNTDVTQLAFAPNGKIFYTDGSPNAFGAIGLFTFGTPDTTTNLIPAGQVAAAHGIIYDPFTGLMTMFGGGFVATMDPNAGTNAAIIASLKQFDVPNVPDFDQGAVDGFGHAFIAGNGELTFIDYSQSHDITNPNNKIIITGGYGSIDDIAPLVGLGAPTPSAVPEPSSILLMGTGLVGLAAVRRRRSQK